MDSLPPNDPNNNGNPNQDRSAAKNISVNDGRGNSRDGLNEDMELFGSGNLGDQAAVFAMFLIGIVAWILRERCIC
jgi:hypothetical protein